MEELITTDKIFNLSDLNENSTYGIQIRSYNEDSYSEWSPVQKFKTDGTFSQSIATGITSFTNFYTIYDETDDSYIYVISVGGTMTVGDFTFPTSYAGGYNNYRPYTFIFKYKKKSVVWWNYLQSTTLNSSISISQVAIKNNKLIIIGYPNGTGSRTVQLGTSGLTWKAYTATSEGFAILNTTTGLWEYAYSSNIGLVTDTSIVLDNKKNCFYLTGRFKDTVSFGTYTMSMVGGSNQTNIFVTKFNIDTLSFDWILRSANGPNIIPRLQLVGDTLVYYTFSFYTAAPSYKNGVDGSSNNPTIFSIPIKYSPYDIYLYKIDKDQGVWTTINTKIGNLTSVGILHTNYSLNKFILKAKTILNASPATFTINNITYPYPNSYTFTNYNPPYSDDQMTPLAFIKFNEDLSFSSMTFIQPYGAAVGNMQSAVMTDSIEKNIYIQNNVSASPAYTSGIIYGNQPKYMTNITSNNIILKLDNNNNWKVIANLPALTSNLNVSPITNIKNNYISVGYVISPNQTITIEGNEITNNTSFYEICLFKFKDDVFSEFL